MIIIIKIILKNQKSFLNILKNTITLFNKSNKINKILENKINKIFKKNNKYFRKMRTYYLI